MRRRLFRLFIDKARAFKEEAEDYITHGLSLNEFIVDDEIAVGAERLHARFRRVLDRAQYDEITGRYLDNKCDLNIYRPIGQALDVASSICPGFNLRDIDLVLYTGGASRMSAVKAALSSFFAPQPCFSIGDEDACNTVALG